MAKKRSKRTKDVEYPSLEETIRHTREFIHDGRLPEERGQNLRHSGRMEQADRDIEKINKSGQLKVERSAEKKTKSSAGKKSGEKKIKSSADKKSGGPANEARERAARAKEAREKVSRGRLPIYSSGR